MSRQKDKKHPHFPDNHSSADKKRKNRFFLLLFPCLLFLAVTITFLIYRTRPVTFEVEPIGFISPDSEYGNLNTAYVRCNIKNHSSAPQNVTFQTTYQLLNSSEPFTFTIKQISIENEDGSVTILPGSVVRIPGKTSLSLKITAVDPVSSMELTTRGAPRMKIISSNAAADGNRNASGTTDTNSTLFKDKEEKLAFLANYLILPTEINDVSYHVIYQDNGKGRVPGPSEWDIRAAFQVDADKIPMWTLGMKKLLPRQVDFKWWDELKTPDFTWDIPSDAEYYKRPDSRDYIVVCPDSNLVLEMVSTLFLPPVPEGPDYEGEIPGYDEYKALAAETLGYDSSTTPCIITELAETVSIADGTKLTFICYRAMFFDSPGYGIPVLVITGNGADSCTVLCEGSYGDDWYFADIDGDGQVELLMQHLIGVSGGAGAYQTDVYHLSGDGISKIFGSPAPEKDSSDNGYFDTLFSLHLSEGYTYTVENNSVGFQTSFTRDFTDANPYFDREGNLTEDARENNETDWLNADPYFYLFMPVDVDGDGIFEIMTAQYTYLYGRADGLGSAYTILKWDRGMGRFYIDRAGFWPYEEHEDEESETDYEKRWEDYESSWYLTE